MLPRQSGDAVVLGTIVYKRMRKRKILPGIGKESAADLRFGEDAGVQYVDDQQGDDEMKISDGFWMDKKGYDVRYVAQAYQVEMTENEIRVLATPYVVQNRGMTLAGPNLEITYSSRMENVIKVHIDHYRGGVDNKPKFELTEDEGYQPEIRKENDKVVMLSGKTRLEIALGDHWETAFYYGDNYLTGGADRATSIIKESNYIRDARLQSQREDDFFHPAKDPRTTYLREQLKTGIGECIYGFGEKFTPFVKNGQTVEMWNNDGETCTGQSYKNIPFYLSSKSYGVFVNSSDKVSFEVNSDTVSKVSFTVPGESLEYFVFGGENLETVLERYTALTGRPALPPAYTFGLWLSTSFTTNYDEETIHHFIDGMAERKIPLQVFHFDCFWMKEYEWCNFEWNKQMYDYAEGAEVVIYGLEKGQKTDTVIYDTDALKVMKIRAVRENNTIKITVPKTEKNMTIRTKDACEILRIEE